MASNVTGGDAEYDPVPLSELDDFLEEHDYELGPARNRNHNTPIPNDVGDTVYLLEGSIFHSSKGKDSEASVNFSADGNFVKWEAPSYAKDAAKEMHRKFLDRFGNSEDSTTGYQWSNFVGYDGVKSEIRDILGYVENPQIHDFMGVEPQSVLLYGPPGNGKTLIGRIIQDVEPFNFEYLSLGDTLSCKVGETETKIRDSYQNAREEAPSVIFIDEIDGIGGRREDASTSSHRTIVNTMLQEMDGLDSGNTVQTIATTNHPEILDGAFDRRFESRIEIPNPDKDTRHEVLEAFTRTGYEGEGIFVEENIDSDHLAEMTEGMNIDTIDSELQHVARNKINEASDQIGSRKALHPEEHEELLRVSTEEIIERLN